MALALTLPLTVTANGRLGTLVQGSPEELAQSIGLLMATRPGERAAVPDYGLPDALGRGLRRDDVVAVIGEWEPRALKVDVDIDGLIEQAANVHATARELTDNEVV